jgi:ATP synthase subunit 6
MTFFSPLEQFDIFPVINFYFGFFDFSITNSTIMFFFLFVFGYVVFIGLTKNTDSSFTLVSSRWLFVLQKLHLLNVRLLYCNGKSEQEKPEEFVNLSSFVFIFIFLINIFGFLPFGFTATSHCAVTFTISVPLFFYFVFLSFKKNGLKVFSLFCPHGTSLFLSLLIIPLELLSYLFRPISLGVRLFANMMAGHILLEVVLGFCYSLMGTAGLLFFGHYIVGFCFIPLAILEICVCLIQSYVFSLLLCVYLNESLYLH